jgi:uncharacterized protein (DUF924 family)
MPAHPNDVLTFWTAAGPRKWFAKDDRFDAAIRLKFEPVHFAAARGEYDAWMDSAEGCLSLLILLDQFPRNLFRGSAHSYATDPRSEDVAVALCQGLADETGDQETLKFALLHRDIIQRFGRFPHRNRSLGRETTPEEQAFLDEGGFAG